MQGGKFVRAESAAPPGEWNCTPILDAESGDPVAYDQYQD
jgi:hypothetical protein